MKYSHSQQLEAKGLLNMAKVIMDEAEYVRDLILSESDDPLVKSRLRQIINACSVLANQTKHLHDNVR